MILPWQRGNPAFEVSFATVGDTHCNTYRHHSDGSWRAEARAGSGAAFIDGTKPFPTEAEAREACERLVGMMTRRSFTVAPVAGGGLVGIVDDRGEVVREGPWAQREAIEAECQALNEGGEHAALPG